MMIEDPIERFRTWFQLATADSKLHHPAAFCLSTVSPQGWPEARFVALKDVDERGFVFCTHLDSQKGASLLADGRAALTFWWDAIQRQVRIQGYTERIPREEAEAFFRTRGRDAQITTWASRQSHPLEASGQLKARLAEMEERFRGVKEVPCPDFWGGFRVVPIQIEFLTFRDDRLHERERFERQDSAWKKLRLQP